MTDPEIFPFFVGCERSGTTLLRVMFDSHPQLAIPHESYFIPFLARRRALYERRQRFNVSPFLQDLLQHKWFSRWNLSEDDLLQALTSASPDTLSDAVRRVFACYAASQHKRRYADKTPAYVQHMPLLAELFPEGRFVHIIRDGRDVALSLREVTFGPTSTGDAAIYWRWRVRRGRAAGRRLGPNRYREIRYEDLVQAPKALISDLCPFLGLEYQDSMVRYFERPDVDREVRHHEHHLHLTEPPRQGLRDWRQDMTPRDLAEFESIAGDLLEELGYERGIDRLGLRSRFWGRQLRVRKRTRRMASRAVRALPSSLRHAAKGRVASGDRLQGEEGPTGT